uniref:Uncharacterized protein n=1 Tax=Cajanus cajan TaxID=3821 RepID=A0A151RWS3_CAJCA|nr:hypothetical protein KK1_031436 [Cajanus cajan]
MLEAEVARLREAYAEMEGRALAAEDAERMRVQEVQELAAREKQVKAEAEAAMATFRAEAFLDFRCSVVERRARFKLSQAQERRHIVE